MKSNDPSRSRRAARAEAQRRARVRRRRNTVGLFVAGALVVGGLLTVALRSNSSTVSDPTATATVTVTNFDLPALTGKGRVRLADFHGKPTVVNFFASWCTQCEAELPGFRSAVDKYRGKVNFVFVNSNDPGDGTAMARNHDLLALAVARDTGGTGGTDLYRAEGGTGGMPITVFYDGNGRVINKSFGALVGSSLDDAIHQVYGVS